MVAGQIPPDIVGARLAVLIDVLVHVVEDKEPVAVARLRQPAQHVGHHSLEVLLAMQHSVPIPFGNLAFRYSGCTASKALPQPVLRSAIQPED